MKSEQGRGEEEVGGREQKDFNSETWDYKAPRGEAGKCQPSNVFTLHKPSKGSAFPWPGVDMEKEPRGTFLWGAFSSDEGSHPPTWSICLHYLLCGAETRTQTS